MYRTYSGDLQGDAEHFFKNASGAVDGLSLLEISFITEGSLAVYLWSSVFNFMDNLGFPREHYIGVMVNVLIMSLNAVVLFKITRLLFGIDPDRFKRMLLFTSACGLFWIFSGVLQRDSLVLLFVNIFLYIWLKYLSRIGYNYNLIILIISSFIAFISFGFLRAEFSFLPFAFAGSACFSILICSRRPKKILYGAFFLTVTAIILFLFNHKASLFLTLLNGYESYSNAFITTNTSESLGMRLIVNQPFPVRLILGSVYLYVFPIPFWSGFQLSFVYHLFKSCNVIFFYFIMPLLFLSFWNLLRYRSHRTPQLMFCLFVVLGFTLAIAGTSLETRHIGAFFGPLFILALLPNLKSKKVWHNYCLLLSIFIFFVFFIHLSWLGLKFL